MALLDLYAANIAAGLAASTINQNDNTGHRRRIATTAFGIALCMLNERERYEDAADVDKAHPSENWCAAQTEQQTRCLHDAIADGLCKLHWRKAYGGGKIKQYRQTFRN